MRCAWATRTSSDVRAWLTLTEVSTAPSAITSAMAKTASAASTSRPRVPVSRPITRRPRNIDSPTLER